MTELRYRAFISYSHQDERWAVWLHRALESYRVPRKLAGRTTATGTVPAKIRPVFRDRDELSSSADLDSTVKQALADSEYLIVLCSPAAVSSRWVGEEIREFARLGRGGRIFCLIVGGETAADGSLAACLPSALADIGLREPLAADARKWADGKRGAKLKLIAGLLGVQLDELRQRDLRRRRKRQVLGGMAAIAALALLVITVLAQVSERNEREKAEQLATFVVDLGERLQSDTDLKTLAIISAESYKYLQGLDPDKLSPETGKKVALALRQMGRVNQGQGRPKQALEALQRSRDLLERLHDKYPNESSLLFELGNAEYYIGSLHRDQGQYKKAEASMKKYYDLSRRLLAADPENPDWMLELAYSNNNLAALQLDSGKRLDQAILGHVAEATRLMERVMTLRPDDKAVASNYASILAWAADAQLRACNLEKVGRLRKRARDLAESASLADPANNDLKRRYAYALTGVARTQILIGKVAAAKDNLGRAIAILQQLSTADPSNIVYHKNVLEREAMLAALLGNTGQLERAQSMMQSVEPEFRAASGKNEGESISQGDDIDFLLAFADVESQLGDAASARRHLQTAIKMQKNMENPGAKDLYSMQRLARTRYQWWQLNGRKDLQSLTSIPVTGLSTPAHYQSCSEADSLARIYVMKNQPGRAAKEVGFLQSMGYAEPNFIRFCTQFGLCAAKP